MINLCAIVVLFVFITPSWGKELEAFPDLQLNDAQGLKEATRVLEEELKLAARPQTYVLIDLVGICLFEIGRVLAVQLYACGIGNAFVTNFVCDKMLEKISQVRFGRFERGQIKPLQNL
ncbi:MAG: hypothetical protein HP496_16005 [Nitrospira sp.]|nr:hypothetical protein [Nitrospira sp.]